MNRTPFFSAVFAAALLCSLASNPASGTDWPDLSKPARTVGGGDHDAAVIVGVEGYAFVPPVPGAESNAKAWYDYLTKTRGVSPARVKLLLGNDGAREDMLAAAQKAAEKAGPEGTLWYVFIGHGAPSIDGKDGLLVGVDAQQKAQSLQTHSLKRGELLKALGASRARKIVVVIDACFSGRGPDGTSIAPGLQPLVTVASMGSVDPRIVVLTAAKGDQFAGALPGAQRPAFSYLILGGLRGWAGQARVTAGDLLRYSSDALEATLTGRNQTPDLIGREEVVVGPTAGEAGPDLAELAKAAAGGGSISGTALATNHPAPPRAQASRPAEMTDDERTFYAYGYKVGLNLIKTAPSEAEANEISQGLRDAVTGKSANVDMSVYLPKVSDMATKRIAGKRELSKTMSPDNDRTDDDRTFYAYGYRVGQNLAATAPSAAEAKMLSQGLRDAITGKPAVVDMDTYLPKVGDLATKRLAAAGQNRKAKEQSYVDRFAKEDGARAIPKGGFIKTLREGTGAMPTANDSVKVHYRGTLIDGSEFDSSYKRDTPATFPLKAVIPCWTNGMQMMKVGGKAKLVCPSDVAYGDQGHPPTIPGGATLIFDVELLDIVR